MKEKEIESRKQVVGFLYNLGLTIEMIAEYMKYSRATIAKDIKSLGGRASFTTRYSESESFSAILQVFAEILTYKKVFISEEIRGMNFSAIFPKNPTVKFINEVWKVINNVIRYDYLKAALQGSYKTITALCQNVQPIKGGNPSLMRAIWESDYGTPMIFRSDIVYDTSGKSILLQKWNPETFIFWVFQDNDLFERCKKSIDIFELAGKLIEIFIETILHPNLQKSLQKAWRELISLSSVEPGTSSMTERELDILRLYYGLEGGRYHSHQEIGDKFKLTSLRVSQIKEKALRRIRLQYKKLNLDFPLVLGNI